MLWIQADTGLDFPGSPVSELGAPPAPTPLTELAYLFGVACLFCRLLSIERSSEALSRQDLVSSATAAIEQQALQCGET